MAGLRKFPYKFNTYDPAIFVEIYLPKKIRYQGVLYKSLRTGFDFKKVKNHLKNPKEFVLISEFLEDYKGLYELYQRGKPEQIKKRVDYMEEMFYGYSMYEVDGVFFNKIRFMQSKAKDKRIGQFIAEERVQFLRMIFFPNIESILGGLGIDEEQNRKEFHRMRSFIKRCIASTSSTYESDSIYGSKMEIERSKYQADLEDNPRRNTVMDSIARQKEVFDKIRKWIDDVVLFLFGFVMYKICREIGQLHREGERPEDEIWITSLGNLDVNRITWRKMDE
jgi:hypothetical protein